jgi:hypothetical protein
MAFINKLIIAFLMLLIFKTETTSAQIDSLKKYLKFTGYVETYYSHDFNSPFNNQRPKFLFSFNRHNEVNINIALLKLNFDKKNFRGNLALMSGTYTNANLADEPGVLKNIYEANAGIKISKNKNIWIDAGTIFSHIGSESAIGKDNWLLTRSILADNSPYYETGVKLSYTTENKKWHLAALVLNGWQKIQRPSGNSTPAFGHQITYTPSEKIIFNSSSFIGSDSPDSIRKMRYYHDFYTIININDNWDLSATFDIGVQQKEKRSENYNLWYSPVICVRYKTIKNWALSFRGEYFDDQKNVLINTPNHTEFEVFGYTLCLEKTLDDNAIWRIEGKRYDASKNIFGNNSNSKTNFAVTSSLSWWF